MNFSDEHYVRVYTRDTKTWRRLGFAGQTVLMHVLRRLDKSGVLDDIDDPVADVALLTGVPEDVVAPGLEACLRMGVLELCGTCLVMPRYLAAQTASRSDAQRARESRERRRAAAMTTPATFVADSATVIATGAMPNTGPAVVTKRDATVTKRDLESQNVTGASQNVTDRHEAVRPRHPTQINADQRNADQRRATQSQPEQARARDAREAPPETTRQSPQERREPRGAPKDAIAGPESDSEGLFSGQTGQSSSETKNALARPLRPSKAQPAKKRVRGARFVPDGWSPQPRHVELARQLGVQLDRERAKFTSHEFRTPRTDWDRAFTGWLHRASEIPGNQQQTPQAEVHPGIELLYGRVSSWS